MPQAVMSQTRRPMRGVALASLLLAGCCVTGVSGAADADTSSSVLPASRYDTDYPSIPYASAAKHNAYARLQGRMDRGEVKLDFKPGRGYLDSLLKALQIDPSSQVLVYSKTSLQIGGITAATPRAVYFNDQVYVGFVQNMPLLELAAVDDELGLVFYTLDNRETPSLRFAREAGRCLTCHDTYSMMGGGVPRVVVLSALIDGPANPPKRETSEDVGDQTPIRDRWGGWYVTGLQGRQYHLGNLPTDNDSFLAGKSDAQRLNQRDLDAWFNTKPYISNKSDVVALMVLEHQSTVQNLFTRASFKVRTVLSRSSAGGGSDLPRTWEEMSGRNQNVLKAMIEPLVKAMFFVDEADLAGQVSGTAGFEAWFQAQGPRDGQGRSLRQLDLKTRLFRYPFSFMVYSPSFDALPPYVKEYVYQRIADILQGRDTSGSYESLLDADRREILEILLATKPDFAKLIATGASATR